MNSKSVKRDFSKFLRALGRLVWSLDIGKFGCSYLDLSAIYPELKKELLNWGIGESISPETLETIL